MEETPRSEWEPIVGRLILVCGDIELLLLQLYWNLTLHGGYDKAIKQKNGMGNKAKFIRPKVDNKFVSKPLRKRISSALEKTIELAHKRNLVAHNPLCMAVYSESEEDFKPSIRSLRDNEKHISYAELAKLNERASKLSAELQELVIQAGHAACPVA